MQLSCYDTKTPSPTPLSNKDEPQTLLPAWETPPCLRVCGLKIWLLPSLSSCPLSSAQNRGPMAHSSLYGILFPPSFLSPTGNIGLAEKSCSGGGENRRVSTF